ncbi:Myristoyl-CoA:protein N-myristoyltransferase, N-terminal domain-containing protein [Dimargaris cristalligena]|uniref:Glycylpeptide N-tetradecanoyltransferase n=1 Tax=Dimargaris cristalligena TaxID=215637 RepID=A0A4P9ZYP1_9FUNG|nr:Myristoyl-CoA:protein N-myristoyltransferase, N-terminal domain-containing protein [Dimargaris cristalligena]|eukprot:RKP38797.1 Myristoyl-CoA:protein N-myristoyltransferase, N-terminal domain-containing protein [Dimargaris cristalligena]
MRDASSNDDYQKRLQTLLEKLSLSGTSVKDLEPRLREHKFWSTQPVPKHGEAILEDGPIKPNVSRDQVRQDPIPLAPGFEWAELELGDEACMKELYELLTFNYVEDDDAMFRFNYSSAFLQWALQPPGWKKQWNIGVRVAASGRLVAFISGIPVTLKIRNHVTDTVEINFMCVHKKLRNKRLAPILIKEITRRVNLEGIFQAVYTAGAFLPTPLATCRYYHRSLSPKKLVETGFSYLPPNWTMARLAKACSVPTEPTLPGLRPMTVADVPGVRALLNAFLDRHCLFTALWHSDEEVQHWLMPVDGVIWSYVVESPTTPGQIDDVVSFYNLPSSVINHPVHKTINAAYLFYYATRAGLDTPPAAELTTTPSAATGESDASAPPQSQPDDPKLKMALTKLIESALTLAKRNDFDVFNCLAMNFNHLFIDDLRFKPGDGYLKFYMYNWRCQPVDHKQVGLVML